MATLSCRWLLVSLLLVIIPLCGGAQTYGCLPDTAEPAQVERDFVVRLVTGTDTETVSARQTYNLPALAASKVSVVTTASACKQAGDAYHAAITSPGTPPVSRTLVVIKVGTTRYVVVDPKEHAGEFQIQYVFDNKWKPLLWLGS